jgi:hypothetical protein
MRKLHVYKTRRVTNHVLTLRKLHTTPNPLVKMDFCYSNELFLPITVHLPFAICIFYYFHQSKVDYSPSFFSFSPSRYPLLLTLNWKLKAHPPLSSLFVGFLVAILLFIVVLMGSMSGIGVNWEIVVNWGLWGYFCWVFFMPIPQLWMLWEIGIQVMGFLNNRGRRAVGVTKKYRTDFELKE